MKATVKPFLYTRRIKDDGKFPVKIRVGHARIRKLYSIGIDMSIKEFSIYHLDKKLKDQFEDIKYYISKATAIVDDLKDNFSYLSFEKSFFQTTVISVPDKHEVLAAFLAYEQTLLQEERIKSAASYKSAHNALRSYLGKKKIYFEDVDANFLKAFDKFMRSKDKSTSTVGVYMRNFRAIFNQAIEDKFITREYYPFGKKKYSPPTSRKSKKALSLKDIELIFTYIPETEIEGWAQDMWMFSYFANGLNVKDLALLKFKNIVNNEIIFIREKTKNSKSEEEIKVIAILSNELKVIISKWGNKDGHPNNYIFDILKIGSDSATDIERNVNGAIKQINKYMGRIAENLKLERKPTTNFARHSFATVLKHAGVPIEMIKEQLGHSDIKTTEIYLGSFNSDHRLEASKHLTAFTKPEN